LAQLNTGGSGLDNGSAPTDASSALGTPVTTDGGLTYTIPVVASSFTQTASGGTVIVSLVDGIYTVTVHASSVNGPGGTHLAADASTNFHRLFGDKDGNKTVNNGDYAPFRAAFGSTQAGGAPYNRIFDFDLNGSINNGDYGPFRARFGKVFTYT